MQRYQLFGITVSCNATNSLDSLCHAQGIKQIKGKGNMKTYMLFSLEDKANQFKAEQLKDELNMLGTATQASRSTRRASLQVATILRLQYQWGIANLIYSESWRRELSIGIFMSRIREGGGGGSSDVVIVFLGGGLQFFWATPTEFLTYHWKPQLNPSRLAPFLSKLGKRGDLWTFPKVRGTCTRCRPGVESSQWSSN